MQMIPKHLNPRPQVGDIWQSSANNPILIVDIVFDKQLNTHVAVIKYLTGKQIVFEVPVAYIHQGVGIWEKVA